METDREKYWRDLDVYNDDLAPEVRENYVVYRVFVDSRKFPQVSYNPVHLAVGVDRSGIAHVVDSSIWFGKKYKDLDYGERLEVIEYLTEWEFVEYRQVGPEDSELFATKKLSGPIATSRRGYGSTG